MRIFIVTCFHVNIQAIFIDRKRIQSMDRITADDAAHKNNNKLFARWHLNIYRVRAVTTATLHRKKNAMTNKIGMGC